MNEHGLAAPHRILMSAAFVFVRVERLVIPLRSDRRASGPFHSQSLRYSSCNRSRNRLNAA